MKHLKLFAASIVMALLVACAAGTTPTTFNDRIAVGYASVQTVLQTADALYTAKKITAADKANVEATADTTIIGLDTARAIAKTDLPGGDAKLTATLTVVTALQSYLATKAPK